MNTIQYWKNRIPFFLVNAVGMTALALFLKINRNTDDTIFFILFVWSFMLLGGSLLTFCQKKRRADRLLSMAEKMKERYLLPEIMDRPQKAEEAVYYRILKLAEKSMLEEIGLVKRERREYREYIEQWIHEVKTPITAMKLLCENNRSRVERELLKELERVQGYTEEALYYARSEYTQQDYSIREINVFDVVHKAVGDNKYLLLENRVQIQVEGESCLVFSDEKWLCFMLSQLLINAVKYNSRERTCIISFYTIPEKDGVSLHIRDNGIGILPEDLPRIFQKGFTGKNGRERQNATGIGLYLCKRLCEKLDISLSVASNKEGTDISFGFHKNDYIPQNSYNSVRTL